MGGKIFILVVCSNDVIGGIIIMLEEKEFGVGVKFIFMVFEGGCIYLKVVFEVFELL